jgi:transposase InsO family protein
MHFQGGTGGKLKSTLIQAGIGVQENNTCRLSVTDTKSGTRFLIDTGAEVSVLAAKMKHRVTPSDYNLFAANGSPIKTYGQKTMCLNLGLRRDFKWTFIIADVRNSIIGADFLSKYKLLVDLHARRLRDQVTDLSTPTRVSYSPELSITTIDINNDYHAILKKFHSVTNPSIHTEIETHNIQHEIHTTGPPTHEKVRPLNPERYHAAKKEFQRMVEDGVCRPSKSSWASPLHIVMKKNGEIRPCGDYRRLNYQTVPDRYPLPILKDFTKIMKGKTTFSKFDIQKAYHAIKIREQDIPKTAIITPFGLFEFTKMTFGLRNAGQTFQRFMDMVLNGLNYVFCYCDDILIASSNEEMHKQHLHEVLDRLNKFGIKLNTAKCEFGKDCLDFLGYHINKDGIRPLQDKIDIIGKYPKPKTINDLRRFLGIINFYRSCIPRAAEHQRVLNKFLHNSKKNDKSIITWHGEADNAFEQCKESIKSAVTLFHPNTESPLSLMTDCSSTCAGAVLQQKVNGNWQPLGFFSKALSPAQTKYSTYDRELLAIYMAIKHFRYHIEGQNVTVYTDHKPLTFAMEKASSNNDTPRRLRQLDFISQFCTEIKHIAGTDNAVADALSRIEEITFPSAINYSELSKDQEQSTELLHIMQNNKKLTFKKICLPGTNTKIVCETSFNKIRPYLPLQYRQLAFNAVHGLSHPGFRSTKKMIADRFFWPSMNKNISTWTKACVPCQKSKIHRHTVSPLAEFPQTDRFEHIHIDIIGPLPLCQDYKYCVTIIDRRTKWPEACPVTQITAESICNALVSSWISRYGCPITITTDQGRQFESDLFSRLMKRLGINKIHTTPYHPQANGQIERWHRSLKSALIAKFNSANWIKELPIVMLGLRSAIKIDSNVSAAQMTLGTTLRLPADLFNVNKGTCSDVDYATQLATAMNSMACSTTESKTKRNYFIHKELYSSDYVFLRRDAIKKSLTAPYEGPYKVLEKNEKVFTIQLPGRSTTVSIDRLKPAFLINDEYSNTEQSSPNVAIPKKVTHSGRVVRPVIRYAAVVSRK